jgi:hypothetical protein
VGPSRGPNTRRPLNTVCWGGVDLVMLDATGLPLAIVERRQYRDCTDAVQGVSAPLLLQSSARCIEEYSF